MYMMYLGTLFFKRNGVHGNVYAEILKCRNGGQVDGGYEQNEVWRYVQVRLDPTKRRTFRHEK